MQGGLEQTNRSLLGDSVCPDEVEFFLAWQGGPEAGHTACALEFMDPLVCLGLSLEEALGAFAFNKDANSPAGFTAVLTEFGC